jgi:serine/threonine-protein kinase
MARDPDVTRPLRAAAEADPLRLVGARLGLWTIGDLIGSGGFGTVYRARDLGGRVGALKLLHAQHAESLPIVARLIREADAIGRLCHPNVVALLDTGVAEDGRPYLVMEMLDGLDLGRSIERDGPREAREVLRILRGVASALDAAHGEGVIHRDVKASNVFLAGPRVVLLDFGIAKLADGAPLTTARQVIGTPASMAPEQIRNEAVDARTDVYGLGVLAFHALTGRAPFHAPSTTIAQYLHLHARRPPVSGLVNVPSALDDVIARAMAISPPDRYPTAGAFVAAFEGALRRPRGTEPPLRAGEIGILVGVHPRDPRDAALATAILARAARQLEESGLRPALDLGDACVFAGSLDEISASALAERLQRDLARNEVELVVDVQKPEA